MIDQHVIMCAELGVKEFALKAYPKLNVLHMRIKNDPNLAACERTSEASAPLSSLSLSLARARLSPTASLTTVCARSYLLASSRLPLTLLPTFYAPRTALLAPDQPTPLLFAAQTSRATCTSTR